MINTTLLADVTKTMKGTDQMLFDSMIRAGYFDLYKITDTCQERSLLYLYRYGLNLWMGEGTVNPVFPEDSVLRILLRLQETYIDSLMA